jgi:hypothetical protein
VESSAPAAAFSTILAAGATNHTGAAAAALARDLRRVTTSARDGHRSARARDRRQL